jgi:hypothetical protein
MPGQTQQSSHLRTEPQFYFPLASSLVAVDADRGISRPLIADDKAYRAIGPEHSNRHLSICRPANVPARSNRSRSPPRAADVDGREAVDAQNSFEDVP